MLAAGRPATYEEAFLLPPRHASVIATYPGKAERMLRKRATDASKRPAEPGSSSNGRALGRSAAVLAATWMLGIVAIGVVIQFDCGSTRRVVRRS